eukprot:296927-Pyramimonas_sp.AAC.1
MGIRIIRELSSAWVYVRVIIGDDRCTPGSPSSSFYCWRGRCCHGRRYTKTPCGAATSCSVTTVVNK